MKKGLVLSGGSLKGCFQAGAIKYYAERGYCPDAIYGISVGSLNSTFLVNDIGKQYRLYGKYSFLEAANNLYQFWIDRIKEPSDIINERSKLSLVWSIIWGKFMGLTDNKPLKELLYDVIDLENLYNSQIPIKIGAVNVNTGEITYFDPLTPNFLDYVIASTSIPVVMPPSLIGGDKQKAYFDGGMRDVAPMRIAIKEDCDEILCIACQSEKIATVELNYGNVFALSERVSDIFINEIVNNDINDVKDRNLMSANNLRYKYIDLKVVRPEHSLNLNLQKFNEEDIKNILELGYQTAKKQY